MICSCLKPFSAVAYQQFATALIEAITSALCENWKLLALFAQEKASCLTAFGKIKN